MQGTGCSGNGREGFGGPVDEAGQRGGVNVGTRRTGHLGGTAAGIMSLVHVWHWHALDVGRSMWAPCEG